MKRLIYILLFLPLFASGQSKNQNYVKTYTYQDATQADTTKARIDITYLDGLGRSMQQIAVSASPSGKDIITHFEYDILGMQSKQYLPFASDYDPQMHYVPNALDLIETYYNKPVYENTENPYSETFIEKSPLKRARKQSAPGAAWIGNADNDNDHTVKYEYTLNVEPDKVRFFFVDHYAYNPDGSPDTEQPKLAASGYYEPGELYKNIVKDENWTIADGLNKTTEEYKNKRGQLILKRTFNNGPHDTYYVYDDFSNLTYVIPPLASDQIVEDNRLINFIGVAVPWTRVARVDEQLAHDYERELEEYDNSEILNLDFLNKYGGQGGLSIIPNSAGGIIVNLNITTTKPMPLRIGEIYDLKDFGNFQDKEQGRIKGDGFEYYFLIKDGKLVIEGNGEVPSQYLNTTLTGNQKLEYSKNYPWTKVCIADAKIAADYEKNIALLDNSEILTTYTPNPYGARGGVAISLDENDNFTLSLNINTTTPLELISGTAFPLDIERRLPDAVLGSVTGDGYEYEISLRENSLYVNGYGTITTLNFWSSRNFLRQEIIKNEVLEGLCYIYHYDGRNRVIEKHIPGKGWEEIVYDRLDRVALTQDENLKSKGKWVFTKYDRLGRVAYTGMHSRVASRAYLQSIMNNASIYPNLFEGRNNTYSDGGIVVWYSNKVYPDTNIATYTINYYDGYNDINLDGITLPTSADPLYILPVAQVKGLPTVTKVRILEPSTTEPSFATNNWITTVKGYDQKGREIWNRTKNMLFGSDTSIFTDLSFTGQVENTQTKHLRAGLPELVINDQFQYDFMSGNILAHYQQTTPLLGTNMDSSARRIFQNEYNDLWQLTTKKVGGGISIPTQFIIGVPLQNINYTYNIRGWLKGINNVNDLNVYSGNSNSLFAFEINYNAPVLTQSAPQSIPLYNGNISETHWRSATDDNKRSYKYQYDALNRLTKANYEKSYGYTLPNTTQLEDYTEGPIGYDKNGNILSLQRYGLKGSNIIDKIDNLSYLPEPFSNRLQRVTDAGPIDGFNNGGTGSQMDYEYDDNGNMTTDYNKKIGTVQDNKTRYNHLNLPTRVVIDGNTSIEGGRIEYIYDATGVKLQKKVIENTGTERTTEYVGGFVYEKQGSANSKLKFYSHPEGYVTVPEPESGQYISNNFEYIYQYKDHLGNVRLSYVDKNKDGLISDAQIYRYGFENLGWGGIYVTYDTSEKIKGNYSGKIVATTTPKKSINTYDMPIQNYIATSYTFSGWVKTTGSTAKISLYMRKSLETAEYTYVSDVTTNQTGGWTYIEKTISVPIDVRKLNVCITNMGNGTVWFDDVQVKRAGVSEIIEENHYYPFGLKHKGYDTYNPIGGNPLAQKYKYNGKELQDEMGLNMYDFGARNYDPALGRWFSIDPKAETSRRWSPYTYAYNNPLRFIDPDGMQAEDVIITGNKSQKAYQELRKSVKGQLSLGMDSNGKLSYKQIVTGPLTQAASDLANAIDDFSIIVNVNASDNILVSDKSGPLTGAFMGADLMPDGTVQTHQEINPEALERMDVINGKPGQTTNHEVTESYKAGTIVRQTGVSVGPATAADAANPNSTYRQAHDSVTPQSGNVTENFYDAQGNRIQRNAQGQAPGAVKLEYTTGNNQVFHTLP